MARVAIAAAVILAFLAGPAAAAPRPCEVTTTADSGRGSFRECAPRGGLIIFRTRGWIDLGSEVVTGGTGLRIEGNGQTGITGESLRIDRAHNAVVRNLAFRSAGTADGIRISNSRNVLVEDNLFLGSSGSPGDGATDVETTKNLVIRHNKVIGWNKPFLLKDGTTGWVIFNHGDGIAQRFPKVSGKNAAGGVIKAYGNVITNFEGDCPMAAEWNGATLVEGGNYGVGDLSGCTQVGSQGSNGKIIETSWRPPASARAIINAAGIKLHGR